MSVALAAPLAVRAVDFAIDPLNAYLRTSQDEMAGDALSIDLVAIGIAPGDWILISRVGAFQPGEVDYEDDATFLLGVFSSSAVLLPMSAPHRVQDVVASGVDPWPTGPTYFDTLSTDIPEDFAVTSSGIQVPPGATHLFLAPPDAYYSDNSDPNGDFGVEISVDDDHDGVFGPYDLDDNDPTVCEDYDEDGCDDCSIGVDGLGPLPDNTPNNDGLDSDSDGICDAGDTDPNDPNVCGDVDEDTCDDCTNGPTDLSNDGPDNDGDGICDNRDQDDDNDSILDVSDLDPFDPNICGDVDADGCEDCSNGAADPSNDGPDNDGDGLCDSGDSDDDNDGIPDASDPSPFDPSVCGDVDADSCDDCSNGPTNPSNDGLDTDGDGICDITDDDDDNDGVSDTSDSFPMDPDQCEDVDGDSCDDCAIGSDGFDRLADNFPNGDGPDNDNDGLCDAGDPDVDNDGVLDGVDTDPFDPFLCGDVDNDTCDDCSRGPADPSNDGADSDSDGICNRYTEEIPGLPTWARFALMALIMLVVAPIALFARKEQGNR